MGERDSLRNSREVPPRARAGSIAGFIRCFLPAVLLCCLLPRPAFAKTSLFLATGNKNGVYYALGLRVKKALEQGIPDIQVVVLETEGSIENARLIGKGIDLAIIQNDVAHYFRNGERVFRFPSDEMQGIISLYSEFVHVLARRSLNTGSIAELRGKRVAVGSRESGTQFNAATILAAHGIAYGDIRAEFLPFSDLKQSIADGKIDAAFVTAGVPAPPVKELQEEVNLVALDPATVTKLQEEYPFFLFTSIPANTYKGQIREVPTVGLRALLVARRGLSSDMVYQIARIVSTDADVAAAIGSSPEGIDPERPLKGISSIDLHPGARKYYQEQGILQRTTADHIRFILVLAIPILALVLFLRYRRHIGRALRRNMTLRLATVFCCFMVLGTLVLHFCERDANKHFSTLPESLWSAIAYLVSGFEDRPPVTSAGRFVSVLMFVLAVCLFGTIAGKFASVFIMKETQRMPNDLRHQIIICNWSERGDRVIKELHAAQAEPNTEIVVITDRELNEQELRRHPAYRKVYFVRSDPVLHSVLTASRIDLAKCVILLADEDSPDADAKSVLIALAICKLCEKKPHIVAEAKNHRKVEHLKDARVDEVICSEDLGLGVLAQSALHAKLSDVYSQLLTYGDDTNEIYVVSGSKLPDWLVGHTFEDISEIMNNNRKPGNPAILVGLRRGEQVILNPRKTKGPEGEGRAEVFEEGDALLVMAYDPPDLSGLPESEEPA